MPSRRRADGIGIIDSKERLVYMNRSLMALHGISPDNAPAYIGRNWEYLYSEKGQDDIRDHVMPALRRDRSWRGESPVVRTDGTVVIAAMSLTLLDDGGFIGTARDVTEQKAQAAEKEALYKQLLRAHKLEAVGRLTGGIAHDFNNLLTVITGNLEIIEDDTHHLPEIKKPVEALRRAVGRGSDLTQRLLAFSRQQVLKPQVVNANDVIAETIKLMRRAIREDSEISTRFAGQLWDTEVDTGQLENAILNLAINSSDAMPAGGRIMIETANTSLDDKDPLKPNYMSPGDYIVISLADTGEGIPPALLNRVFEPFFTTKESGKGSGLGLSMVYGFVKQSGGYVTIDSAQGAGTTVRLYFPRVYSKPASHRKERPAAAPVKGGNETILLVEDENDILNLASNTLSRLGYNVRTADSGVSALALARQMKDIDLLLTDIVMPGGMNGKELAAQIKTLFPRTKVLMVSGYARDALRRDNLAPADAALLSKPYSREELARAVRRVIES